MKIIYKGASFSVVKTNTLGYKARLFNLANKYFVEMDVTTIGFSLDPEVTKQMPVGAYNLEVYTDTISTISIVEYIESFAVVKESSFALTEN